MKPLNWATLGCGVIANELATALARQNRHLYSVANRTHEKAVAFAEKYQISKVYDRLEDVFTDPDVDIIYISTHIIRIFNICVKHWQTESMSFAKNPSP